MNSSSRSLMMNSSSRSPMNSRWSLMMNRCPVISRWSLVWWFLCLHYKCLFTGTAAAAAAAVGTERAMSSRSTRCLDTTTAGTRRGARE